MDFLGKRKRKATNSRKNPSPGTSVSRTAKTPRQTRKSKRARNTPNRSASLFNFVDEVDLSESPSSLVPPEPQEEHSETILTTVTNRMNDFIQSSGLISDEEDDDVKIIDPKISINDSDSVVFIDEDLSDVEVIQENTEKPRTTEDQLDDILNEVGAIDTVSLDTFEDIQDCTKETQKLFEDANSLFKKLKGDKPKEPESKRIGDCPICLESMSQKQVTSTACGHLFCKECIQEVAKTIKKCPTCRKAISKAKIFPIYI